jgi:hypothetical protein
MSGSGLAFGTRVSFDKAMNPKVLRLLFLFMLIIAQIGCASTSESSGDWTPDQEHVTSHDDSHGWGANLQGSPR